MPPDLNSLPPSRSPSSSSRQHDIGRTSLEGLRRPASPLRTSSNTQTPADAAAQRPSRSSPRVGRLSLSERRRSAAGVPTTLPDAMTGDFPVSEHRSIGHAFRTASPSSGPGASPIFATGDPHHHRAPSLGEIHQELEQEQEAQVNRLLQMIQAQHRRLQWYQQQQQHQQSSQAISSTTPGTGTAVVDDPTPPPHHPASASSFPPLPPLSAGLSRSGTQIPSSLSNRRTSRSSSFAASPNLPPLASMPLGSSVDSARGSDGFDWNAGSSFPQSRRSSTDEGAFYQAEAAMLSRENQMLRQRIRELERQIHDMTPSQGQPGPARVGETVSLPSVVSGESVTVEPAITGGSGLAEEIADKP